MTDTIPSCNEHLIALKNLLDFVCTSELAADWNTFSTPECVITASLILAKSRRAP